MTDLDKLIAAVNAGVFPGDVTARDLGAPDAEIAILTFYEAFSGSLDAAKALHDALLPGWAVEVYCKPFGMKPHQWFCMISDDHTGWGNGKYFNAGNETPARAWLLAILRAHRSQVQP